MRDAKRRGQAVVARGIVLAAMLLAWSPAALALDPALDISQYAHMAWKVRDGAFKDAVGSIAQTPDGYLWLGTQFGLVRSDGVRHVPWQPPAGHQLPSDHIRSLLAARDGRLWIGTWLGLASWKDGKLTPHAELAGHSVGVLLEDREGTVWAGTRHPAPGKLCAFRRDRVQCYGEGGEFGDRAGSLYEDRSGNLWVGAHTGLWRWNSGPPKLYPFPDIDSSQGVVETDTGALLIVLRGGLKQLIDDQVVPWPLPVAGLPFQPSRVLRDRDGVLWIGTFDRGLVRVHQGRLDLFSQSDGLSGNYIRHIFEDREGNIWVATDNGLDRFRDVAVVTVSVNQGLSQSTPWSLLAARDGSVWVGTLDGLNRLRDGQLMIYRHQSSLARRGAVGTTGSSKRTLEPGGPGAGNQSAALWTVREITDAGLPNDLIHSLFEDDGGRIWVSTHSGVAYFENERFVPISGIPGSVHAFAGDAAGNIWISEDQSLVHVVGGRVTEQIPWARLGRDTPAMPMLADPAGSGLWLGFRAGGLAYFRHGRILASYGAAQRLGRGMVGGLHRDADGTLWAATEGGLSRIKDSRVHTLTAKNGLPCDGVHWVVEDDDHAFWLYTACGLARIARSEVDAWAAAVDEGKDTQRRVSATIFDSSDGVRIHAAPGGYTPQVGKSTDGRIWFLPWDGVSVINPRRLPFNRLPPPVHIEQITADGQIYDATRAVRLPPLVRDLSIDYTALSLVAPEKIRFRYKLEGQDPDWKEVVNDRRVQYSNLPPGDYRFRVVASNNSGVWNETGASLAFAIAPAYYQATWFRVLSIAALAGLLWTFHRRRTQQLQQQERNLREAIETIPTAAWIIGPDGSSEFVNRRWVEYTGLSAKHTTGSGWHAVLHPDDLDRHLAKWRTSLARGEPFEDEARFRRAADGEYRWFLVRAVPLRDKTGKILKWYGVTTDIEDRKDAERALEELAGELIDAQEQERRRIGRELHDDISQTLAILAIKIDQLRADPAAPRAVATALDELRQDAADVTNDVHQLSHRLHSSTLDHLGLVPALDRLVGEFSIRHGIPVAFTHESVPPALPSDPALCLFRIAQESLNNVAKHSQARSAQVHVMGDDRGVHLRVEDDGVGFDLLDLERREGLGLVSMRERLRLVHGSLHVDSAPGQGTRIEVLVPASSLVDETPSTDASCGSMDLDPHPASQA